MFNDDLVDEAFMGQGISTSSSAVGNVMLWNPSNSGKLLYVDRVIVAGEADKGADIRYCRSISGMSEQPDHMRSKRIDGAAPTAKIYVYSGTPPEDYPYNRPVQEIWLAGNFNDKTYTFDPAIVVPQGRGVIISMANPSKALASFQWREKPDTANPPADTGTIISDLSNPANAFDGSESTFSEKVGLNCYIGKTWLSSKTLTRFVLKSPTGRSFSGGNPGRALTYTLESYNGSTWSSSGVIGSYTEPGTGATQSVIDVSCSVTAFGFRVSISESAAAAHRVSEAVFYI